jgi:hypothetical protein
VLEVLHELYAAQFHSFLQRLRADAGAQAQWTALNALRAEMEKAAGPAALWREYRKPSGFAAVSNDSAAAQTGRGGGGGGARGGGGGGGGGTKQEDLSFTSMEDAPDAAPVDDGPMSSRLAGYGVKG